MESYVGTNGKMTEASAAMGLRMLEYHETERSNYQYVVVLMTRQSGLSRDEFIAGLYAEGVFLARRSFLPRWPSAAPYRESFAHGGRSLPETERLTSQVLLLQTGTAVVPEMAATI
jgi:dTDP-4-amino-4,6-dideoxygalactose transaminase